MSGRPSLRTRRSPSRRTVEDGREGASGGWRLLFKVGHIRSFDISFLTACSCEVDLVQLLQLTSDTGHKKAFRPSGRATDPLPLPCGGHGLGQRCQNRFKTGVCLSIYVFKVTIATSLDGKCTQLGHTNEVYSEISMVWYAFDQQRIVITWSHIIVANTNRVRKRYPLGLHIHADLVLLFQAGLLHYTQLDRMFMSK